jgi:hypothetical protein
MTKPNNKTEKNWTKQSALLLFLLFIYSASFICVEGKSNLIWGWNEESRPKRYLFWITNLVGDTHKLESHLIKLSCLQNKFDTHVWAQLRTGKPETARRPQVKLGTTKLQTKTTTTTTTGKQNTAPPFFVPFDIHMRHRRIKHIEITLNLMAIYFYCVTEIVKWWGLYTHAYYRVIGVGGFKVVFTNNTHSDTYCENRGNKWNFLCRPLHTRYLFKKDYKGK